MLRTIYLHGPMGRKFGKIHELDVASLAEAFRALGVMLKGFKKYVEERHFKCTVGRGLNKGFRLGEEHVQYKIDRGDIHVMPVVSGAGGKMSPVAKIIAGVVIAAVAWWAAPFTILGMSASSFALIGVGMALTGVSQLLSNTKSKKTTPTQQSYMFDQVDNTTVQGGPVPLAFGECLIGSVVISGSVTSVDSDGFN